MNVLDEVEVEGGTREEGGEDGEGDEGGGGGEGERGGLGGGELETVKSHHSFTLHTGHKFMVNVQNVNKEEKTNAIIFHRRFGLCSGALQHSIFSKSYTGN